MAEPTDNKGPYDTLMANHDQTLESFLEYLKNNPSDRFWQALRNWSGNDFIFFGNMTNRRGSNARVVIDTMAVYLDDTFNYAGKDK